ncbi:sensor histidine kinase [Polaribacter reichenbachii]|uniref:histidine kinase n=1 Tax=Polaribacter reichenbachii TaxID=996801 RepID=A0A1B8U5Z0_9FLAO|nr:ATP-binding protein [Polaribacter reichenbachii]APZ45990.1 sensor histidine kinase [Polaribacter reichenbachii]AUC19852.1 sensor histidine kinase [Polaribacter reichenbachii]OBY67293.1 histidine kinase [Polaribacter reichenbachii]
MEEFFVQEDQVIIIVLTGVLFLLLMGVSLLLFFFFSRKKIVEKEIEKNILEITYQKEIIQSIIITQEEERKRIAQDLHDDISSKLNVINLNANLLLDGELTPDEYTFVNKLILEVTDRTLKSARKIAHNLLPPILEEFGFKDAVEELADTFNNSRKINIEYTINYPKKLLVPQNELHLFRITQELINNSIKHGKANNSKINISYKNNELIYSYTDNGVGFNVANIDNKKGLGIKNIESRVTLLNGKYNIDSKIGKGFKIEIII